MRSASRTQYPGSTRAPDVDVLGTRPVEPVDDHPRDRHGERARTKQRDRPERPTEAPRHDGGGRHRRQGEQQPFALRGRRRREEEPREHERRTGALHEPDAETEKPERSERGDDGVGVAGCSVLDQGRGSRQHERGRGGDGRHDHDAQDRPGPPPERDQRDRRLDVGERRIEAADRPGGERFEAGQQDGVLLMLHSVRRVGEDGAPDVPFHVQRVRLGRPHRPAVPDVESRGGTEAEDPNREHCEEHKGGELERPGDRAGPGKLELPEAWRSPAEDDPGDEQGGDGQHAGGCRADVDPHHRTQDRDEAARREAHGERQAEEGRKPASVPPYSRQQHDGRADHRDAAVQQHEPDRVAHDRRRPSQTPSTTSTSAKASEIGGEGAPKTITASALARSEVATAG